MKDKTREWFIWAIKELSPKGKQMFNHLRDGQELTVKEWAAAIDQWRDSMNGNERRQLDKMLRNDLVLRDYRLIEFERVRPAGWGGATGDDWHNLTVEQSHRGRYYVYYANPEALEALQPPAPPPPLPKPVEPRRESSYLDEGLRLNPQQAKAYERERQRRLNAHRDSWWEIILGWLESFGEWVWRLLQAP